MVGIKGMKMPQHCGQCPIGWCKLWKECEEYDRNPDCPLVEVPTPHGRLIDADELRKSIKESLDECHKWANEVDNDSVMYARISQSVGTFVECSLRVKSMPTIIEAEDGE